MYIDKEIASIIISEHMFIFFKKGQNEMIGRTCDILTVSKWTWHIKKLFSNSRLALIFNVLTDSFIQPKIFSKMLTAGP